MRETLITLYEDPSCLVINKPAGIAVEELKTMGHLVHRLDKGTTGCLLIAKSDEAREALQKQFKDRTVGKTYLAIVAGVPKETIATIEAPIGRSLGNRTRMSLFRTGKTRSATTTYAVLSMCPAAALLQCDLHTGRTHQIRVHLSAIGHPILGDETYGTRASRDLSWKYDIASPMLHAWRLAFASPATGERLHVEAPVPEGLLEAMERAGLVFPIP